MFEGDEAPDRKPYSLISLDFQSLWDYHAELYGVSFTCTTVQLIMEAQMGLTLISFKEFDTEIDSKANTFFLPKFPDF
jgi:hypothetical protein